MPVLDYPPSVLKGSGADSLTRRELSYGYNRSLFDATVQAVNSATVNAVLAAQKLNRLYPGFHTFTKLNVVDGSLARKCLRLDFRTKRRPSEGVTRLQSNRPNAELRRQYKEKKAGNPYATFRREVEHYALLPKGWDSYHAEAPGKPAIDLALRFLALAESHATSVKWVAPTVDDSIMVTLETDTVRQEWEFYGSGQTAVMIRKAGGSKEYYDVDENDFVSRLLG